MTDQPAQPFLDDDRISHALKGLGTIKTNPQAEDMVVSDTEMRKDAPDTVYVVWDDARFEIGNVPVGELEHVPEASAAISSGV